MEIRFEEDKDLVNIGKDLPVKKTKVNLFKTLLKREEEWRKEISDIKNTMSIEEAKAVFRSAPKDSELKKLALKRWKELDRLNVEKASSKN